MKFFVLMILLLMSTWSAAAPVQVRDARIEALPAGTRLTFELSAPAKPRSLVLGNPPRLAVDIDHARLPQSARLAGLRSADIRAVRAGIRSGSHLRIVLDLAAQRRSQVYTLPAAKGGGHRLVIDIERSGAESSERPQRPPRAAGRAPVAPAVAAPAPARKTTPARSLPKGYVIVIDPGHGGKDPGAIGARRTQEKHIVLQIARRLKKLVDQEPGMRAVLTRDGDEFLHLRERVRVARRHQADLFISIHADAYIDPQARGSSVFILSTKGASSAAARWLATRENEADLVGGGRLSVRDQALRPVVFDIYQDAVLAASLGLAEHVLGHLGGMGRMHRSSVERAGFAVLKAPDIPSILVETAFLSNPQEEIKLRNSRHQQKIAEAIMKSVRAYFRNRPPKYLLAEDAVQPPPGPASSLELVSRLAYPAAPESTIELVSRRAQPNR